MAKPAGSRILKGLVFHLFAGWIIMAIQTELGWDFFQHSFDVRAVWGMAFDAIAANRRGMFELEWLGRIFVALKAELLWGHPEQALVVRRVG